jgi:PAS domain S-box-containing protein
MMDSLSHAMNILVLTSREEDAEGIITSLRNGGLAVHGTFTQDPAQLTELTGSQAFDLILCCEYDPSIDLAACMRSYSELDIDLPLIVVAGKETDSTSLIMAMRAGARDLAELGDTDHLQLIVSRELSDLGHRRTAQRLRERLRDCEQRAKDVMDSSGDAVAFIQDGMHIQVNPAYQELFGFAAIEDLEGYPLLDLIAPDDQGEARSILRQLEHLFENETRTMDIECVRADDNSFPARLNLSRSKLDGEPCLQVSVQGVLRQAVSDVRGLVDEDTGLPNRAALIEELSTRLDHEHPASKSFAAIYFGINAFSQILQKEGMTAALEAAASFGKSLKAVSPKGSFPTRVCEDSFVLLIDSVSQNEAEELAARIAKQAQLPIQAGTVDEGVPVIGTGIMLLKPGSCAPSDVLDNVYRDYLFGTLELDEPQTSETPSSEPTTSAPDPGLDEEGRRLASRIDQALEGEGFQLLFQPVVSLKGDSQENYSVLLCLRDSDGKILEAKEFLSAAIGSGKMIAVDHWVIRHAIAELAAKRSQGIKLNFFINIAEETLLEDRLLIWICDCLQEFEARGNWLTFQIPEEQARRHTAAFTRLSDGLRKVKCRVALNQFGAGQNPEALLTNLRPDFIIFSRELAKGLADDEVKQKRLIGLAELARDAGIRCMVTGVESARTLTVLWTTDIIDYVQGNFLQKPSPVIEAQDPHR